MSTWYVDLVNGNDSNDGLTTSTPKLSLTTAVGNEYRVRATPVPTLLGVCGWTIYGNTVTIPSGIVQEIDLCEATTNWYGGRDITETIAALTTGKQGTYYIKAGSTNYGAATGEFAYIDLGASTDLSAYQQLSFYSMMIGTGYNLVAGDYCIKLYSDTARATLLTTINFPATTSAFGSAWVPFTLDNGSALPNNVRQISFCKVAGTTYNQVLAFDDIIACLPPSNDASLNLNSLIGTSSIADSNMWYPILSITNSSIVISSGQSAISNSSLPGTTEATGSYNTYKRECINTYGQVLSLANGTSDSYVTVKFGWNFTTDTQTGMTCYSRNNTSNGSGTLLTYGAYGQISNLIMVSAGYAYNGANLQFTNVCVVGTNNMSYPIGNTYNNCSFNNNQSGVSGANATFNNCNILNNANGNIGNCSLSTFNNCISGNSGSSGNECTSTGKFTLNSHTFIKGSNYHAYAIYGSGSYIMAYDTNIGSFSQLIQTNSNSILFSTKENNTLNNDNVYYGINSILSKGNSVVHTSGGFSWKLVPASQTYRANNVADADFITSYIPCKSGQTLTITAWLKKDHATNIIAQLVVVGDQIAGVPSDVVATCPNDTNWDQVSLSFTPSENGSVCLSLRAYYASGNSDSTLGVYIDDIGVS